MKSVLILLATFFLWHGEAVAGFQWIPPEPNPTAQEPAAKTKDDFLKKNRMQGKAGHGQTLTPAQRLDNIYDYESKRISTMKEQEALQDKEKTIKANKGQFLPSDSQALNQTITKTTGMIPFKTPDASSARTAMHAGMANGKPIGDMAIDPTEKPVVGFGAQVPLALAVSDIVPDHYSFSFDSGVNPGLLVSWEGLHRPWNIVLSEMLAQRGLSAVIDRKTLKIFIDPSRPPMMPVTLPGALYSGNAAGNFAQRGGLAINPMPDPKQLHFSNTAMAVHAQTPPLQPTVPASTMTPMPGMPAQGGAPAKPRLHISSFPLQDNAAQNSPAHTTMTPIAQDKKSLVISDYPLQDKAPAAQQNSTKQNEPVYISRKQSHADAETSFTEKVSGWLSSLSGGK